MPEFRQKLFTGGIAESVNLGIENSFYDAVGINIHSKPGLIYANQAMAKNSGSTVTDLCNFAILSSGGSTFWFGDSGKIYKRTSAGVWSNVYTDSNGAILGAAEYDGYIYWATATRLGRQTTSLAESEASWSSQNNAWQTITSSSWHPMLVQGLYLYVGNHRTIASVDDAGTFTSAGTPDVTLAALEHNLRIKCLNKFGIDILVGTETIDGDNKAKIKRWDTTSPTYNSDDDIAETGINIIINTVDNYTFCQAGGTGNLYYYNGKELELSKTIQGDYANKLMTINPGSQCTFQGLSLFGISNSSSNPLNQGAWSLGRHDKNFPYVPNLEYPTSVGNLTGVTIGALMGYGNNLFMAWKDTTGSTTYGVDAINWSAKYASAYLITLAIKSNREKRKTWKKYVASYKSLPTSTAIVLSYLKNYGSAVALTSKTDSTWQKEYAEQQIDAGVMQLKCALTISSNNSPEIEELYMFLDEQETL